MPVCARFFLLSEGYTLLESLCTSLLGSDFLCVLALILEDVEISPRSNVACGVARICHSRCFWVEW